jgi:hypothetical protein
MAVFHQERKSQTARKLQKISNEARSESLQRIVSTNQSDGPLTVGLAHVYIPERRMASVPGTDRIYSDGITWSAERKTSTIRAMPDLVGPERYFRWMLKT